MSDSIDKEISSMIRESESLGLTEDKEIVENKTAEEVAELKAKIAELEEQLSVRETCKRCGRELGTNPITVSDDVTEEYFRAMLGQRPFEKTFRLFNGQLLLTFRELSGDAIIENNKDTTDVKDADEFSDVLEMYLITGMLVKVELYDSTTMTTTAIYSKTEEELVENTKNPKKAYDELLRAVGQMKIAVIRRVCNTFEYLITALIEKGQDENFYKGAGLL